MAALLAIGLLDEVVFGAREAAWPLIRDDLSLSYGEIGCCSRCRGSSSLAVEPVLGLVAVTWRRRALVLGGGLAFARARSSWRPRHVGVGAARAFALLYPASGAFVSLSQASLMDLRAVAARAQHGALDGRGRRSARSSGRCSWRLRRGPGSAGAGCSLRSRSSTLALVRRHPRRRPGGGSRPSGCACATPLRAIARREVLRWLLLLELADLLLDVFAGFLALYLVDEAGASHATAGSPSRSGRARASRARRR